MAAPIRIGQGLDVHAFSTDRARPLVLGGVRIPDAQGLAGHSDADVVLHAIVDALLGAGGLGDLGERFGTSRPEWAGAVSSAFVTATLALLDQAGWSVTQVDCTVVAARPRLAEHRGTMRARTAELLGVEPTVVSIKATTTDGLGAVGRGEGIACMALAVLSR